MLLRFRKHGNCGCPGWSIERKVRGYATPQRFLRWFSNEKVLGIYYGVVYSRFINFKRKEEASERTTIN